MDATPGDGNAAIEETIKQTLARVTEKPELAETLHSDTDIIDRVGLDSLQMIQLFLILEEELDVEIDFEGLDFAHMESVGALASFLASCPAAGQGEW